jgi:hypothetical protein
VFLGLLALAAIASGVVNAFRYTFEAGCLALALVFSVLALFGPSACARFKDGRRQRMGPWDQYRTNAGMFDDLIPKRAAERTGSIERLLHAMTRWSLDTRPVEQKPRPFLPHPLASFLTDLPQGIAPALL